MYDRVYFKLMEEHSETLQCLIYKCRLHEALELMIHGLKPRPGEKNIYLLPFHPNDKKIPGHL